MDASSNATPINQITSTANANANTSNNNTNNQTHITNASINNAAMTSGSVVFENGTIMGAVCENNMSYNNNKSNNANNSIRNHNRHSSYYQEPEGQFANIPEIVINGSYSSDQNLHNYQQQQLQQQQQQQHYLNQYQRPIIGRQQTETHITISTNNCDEAAIESTALLVVSPATASTTNEPTTNSTLMHDADIGGMVDVSDVGVSDEFEQFMLNRSTSDSNILDSSFYSELQYQHTLGMSYGGAHHELGGAYIDAATAQQYQLAAAAAATRAQLGLPPLPQTPSVAAATAVAAAAAAAAAADLLNTSTCSRESSARANSNNNHSISNNQNSNNNNNNNNNNNKRTRTRRTHKSSKAKWNANVAAAAAAADVARGAATAAVGAYPPQYTAIFLDHGNVTAAANAMGQMQIANAAAASPFLNAPLVDAATAAAYLQQQPYQLITTATAPYAHLGRHHMHHRRFLDTSNGIVNNPAGIVGAATSCGAGGVGGVAAVGSSTDPHTIAASGSGTCGPIRSTVGKCFSRPIVPFIIGIFALGGAACTLGGVVLGATGLIEHTTQYLSASLLMIGIGLSLLVVSGIIWRLCSPGDADECPCYRLMENCRNCNSPFCNNRLLSSGYLYPEFQHRPPPPSYLTSLHECAAIGLINGAVYSGLRMNTPPPLYRSTNSLSVFVPGSNSNTQTLTTNTPTTTFTPTTVMPNNNHRPPQTGPPNYTNMPPPPPVALHNNTATTLLAVEQTVLIENLQTDIQHEQHEQQQQQQQQNALTQSEEQQMQVHQIAPQCEQQQQTQLP